MRLWPLAVLFLGACASGETIYMQNAAGHRVQCGPYGGGFVIAPPGDATSAARDYGRQDAQKMRDCTNDFQRQGYRRIDINSPPPPK